MSHHQVLCIGATEQAHSSLATALAERTETYSVSVTPTLDSPGDQLGDVNCVVAFHDSAVSGAGDIVEAVRSASKSLPVVVYTEAGSEDLAATALNAGANRYVSANEGEWDRLASAIAEVSNGQSISGGSLEQQFHPADIVEQLPTAAFVINRDHEVTYWNEACANLLEYGTDEMIGRKEPYQAFYDESRPVMADLVLEDADAETISQWYDEWYDSPHLDDGIVGEDYFPELDVWLRFTAAPLTDASGETVGAIETLEEITQRKKHKQELERYETIIETSGDPVYTLDEGGYFTFVDGNVSELTGYSKSELMGSHVSKVVRDDHVDRAKRRVQELLDSDSKGASVEADIITATGNRRACEIHIAPLPREGRFQGTVGVVRDITERKERERELQKFKHAVNQAGHAIFLTDPEGTIEYVNPAFEEISGYDREEAIGSTPSILNSGEQDSEFYEDLWETILGGDVWEGELVNEGKSGERFVVYETIAPILSDDDTIRGFVGIQDEITARRLQEQQLKVFHRVLRHNLRNKGSAIKGHADILERSYDELENEKHLDTIQDNVQSLIDISEKAHHVRQVVADALDETANRGLFSVLESIANRVSFTYPGADISLDYEPRRTLEIDAKATHAFHELVENAVRHSDEPTPRVEIGVTATDRKATVTISDNGPGIPNQEQRVLSAGTEDQLEHSSGLGLWFAHWLIHFVGGDIDIDVDDYGTTILVNIPVTDTHQP